MAIPPEQGKALLVDSLPAAATTSSAPDTQRGPISKITTRASTKNPPETHQAKEFSATGDEDEWEHCCPWESDEASSHIDLSENDEESEDKDDDMGSFIVEDDERELLLGKGTVEDFLTFISEQSEGIEQRLSMIEANMRQLQTT